MLLSYNIVLMAILVAGLPFWLWVLFASAKHRRSFLPRIGWVAYPWETNHLPPAPATWIHALSVGEVRSAEPLVNRWRERYPDQRMVFSATTHSGYQQARQLFEPSGIAVVYFPYDLPMVVHRMVARVRPERVIIVETDIWPNFLTCLKRSGIPVFWANARLSDRSFRRYRRLGPIAPAVFSLFSAVLAQTEEDGRRFAKLGLDPTPVKVTGNIKFDQPPAERPSAVIRQMTDLLQLPDGVRVILAGSTHPGEEQILARVFSELAGPNGRLRLVIVPRDPDQSADVEQVMVSAGLTVCLLSDIQAGGCCAASWQAVVIDRIGLLRELYAVADLAFIGGSLAPFGGHNPLEAAAWAKPILFGPDMRDFVQVAKWLVDGGGAFQVSDEQDLARQMRHLLSEPQRCRQMGKCAQAVFYRHQGAVDRTLAAVAAVEKKDRP